MHACDCELLINFLCKINKTCKQTIYGNLRYPVTLTNELLLTVFLCFSTGQKEETPAIHLHYYKLTIYKLFSDKHTKSTHVAQCPKSGRFVTSQFNVLCSTMLPIATAGFCPKYGFAVPQLLKPGSQYDARASVALRASGCRWNRLDFYSSIASRALTSVQPIRLSKNLATGMQFDQ